MVDLMCVHGMAGIGVFWCIIEQLYQSGGKLPIANYKSIAFALHVECTLVASVVQDFSLFQNDGTMFWSESVMKRMNKKREISEKRKQAINARWNKSNEIQTKFKSNTNVLQMESNCNSNGILTQNEESENSTGEYGNLGENMGIQYKCNSNGIQMNAQTDTNVIQKNAIKDIKDIKEEKEINKEKSVREKRSVFTPPTLEEVKDYVSEKGYTIDPVKFWNFYESKGWMVGKNKMKKWKAAVANWASTENKPSQSPVSGGRGHDGIKHCNDEWQ